MTKPIVKNLETIVATTSKLVHSLEMNQTNQLETRTNRHLTQVKSTQAELKSIKEDIKLAQSKIETINIESERSSNEIKCFKKSTVSGNTPHYMESQLEKIIFSSEEDQDDSGHNGIDMLYEISHIEVLENILLNEFVLEDKCVTDGSKSYGVLDSLRDQSRDLEDNNQTEETNCNSVFHKPKIEESLLQEAQKQILEKLKPLSINSLRDLTSTTNTVTHSIKLKPGAVPLKQKERRIAHYYEKEFEEIIDDMLESKKIQPTHTSPWASPLRLLRKKDKSIRVTVDYQYLNSVTERVAYPFPFADVIFSKLAMAVFFTVIDLTSGYYQVPLDPDCRAYTAFLCSKGCFEYLVLPMGLTNAVETFQRLMNEVLKGLINDFCQVYLDDIIIYSATLDDHIEHVQIVVERLKQHNLKIKLSKCKIAQTKVE